MEEEKREVGRSGSEGEVIIKTIPIEAVGRLALADNAWNRPGAPFARLEGRSL